ncbi:hypothetical protein SAMN06265365_14812 [Tistlia consotensis]|uniref:Uncharacterized protein n=1 Tax=Tistlia consotensis USBA 355 TaxID=560819 RepID=A0A1Y6CW08_9PROT|nr:hypothetical protein [Tistlia consotensis]SMF82863.1 hypothetical protein SAMN05428998_14813 [Tistlia consotensis USBA 355]SNS31193.1 hypothetical protein SAMN06265365_14812 [Tistlia consotensis]
MLPQIHKRPFGLPQVGDPVTVRFTTSPLAAPYTGILYAVTERQPDRLVGTVRLQGGSLCGDVAFGRRAHDDERFGRLDMIPIRGSAS